LIVTENKVARKNGRKKKTSDYFSGPKNSHLAIYDQSPSNRTSQNVTSPKNLMKSDPCVSQMYSTPIEIVSLSTRAPLDCGVQLGKMMK
jgi:hypothetical protein